MRLILNGIFYVLRSGGAWRLLPHDYPAWSTAYDYFRKWRNTWVWDQLVRTLLESLRVQAGREAAPRAGIIAFSLTHIGEREESKPRRSSQQGETKKLPLEDDLLWMHARHYGMVGESKSSS